jgi:hypothetical protein
VAPDATAQTGEVDSPDASYDHPTCRDGFVVEYPNVRDAKLDVGEMFYVGGTDPATFWDDLFCGWNWVDASLWQNQGGTFVRVSQQTAYSKWTASPFGTVCAPPLLEITPPSAGEYKVVASAGFILGAKKRVYVRLDEPYGAYCAPVLGQPCNYRVAPQCTSGIVDPTTPGTTGCYAGEAGNGCVPNSVDAQTRAYPCTSCGHHPSTMEPWYECGGCAEEPCTTDANCSPGLACDATTQKCVDTCTVKEGFCWAPSLTGNYGVSRAAACQ